MHRQCISSPQHYPPILFVQDRQSLGDTCFILTASFLLRISLLQRWQEKTSDSTSCVGYILCRNKSCCETSFYDKCSFKHYYTKLSWIQKLYRHCLFRWFRYCGEQHKWNLVDIGVCSKVVLSPLVQLCLQSNDKPLLGGSARYQLASLVSVERKAKWQIGNVTLV